MIVLKLFTIITYIYIYIHTNVNEQSLKIEKKNKLQGYKIFTVPFKHL